MGLRLYIDLPLASEQTLSLPAGPARHVQVLRLQPGDGVTLFNGLGGEYAATIVRMGRSDVAVELGAHDPVERELQRRITLVAAMPANDRFDWLVEKATELGAAAIEPVQTERSVLRLNAERAEKKRAHWQGVATAAAEQCGRTRVPAIAAVRRLDQVLTDEATQAGAMRLLLAWRDATPLRDRLAAATGELTTPVRLFSGPEGGFTAEEEDGLRQAGASPTHLGGRVLRSETAPLAALAWLSLQS